MNQIITGLFINLKYLDNWQKTFITNIAKQLSENKNITKEQIKKIIAIDNKVNRMKINENNSKLRIAKL